MIPQAPKVSLPSPPEHWQRLEPFLFPKDSGNIAAQRWQHRLIPMTVLRSLAQTTAGIWWIHLSMARPDRIPSWVEIKKVGEEFLGDRTAMHMIPKKKDYVNVHPHCLHLWAMTHDQDDDDLMPNLMNLTWETGI